MSEEVTGEEVFNLALDATSAAFLDLIQHPACSIEQAVIKLETIDDFHDLGACGRARVHLFQVLAELRQMAPA